MQVETVYHSKKIFFLGIAQIQPAQWKVREKKKDQLLSHLPIIKHRN